ncbi:MAG: hypothetical protein RDV48_23550 [Candidatus Eremiobacteraeota bacterium]|nr:hypothetical protein [Candidatus Eremiobacteraeota bacterium]
MSAIALSSFTPQGSYLQGTSAVPAGFQESSASPGSAAADQGALMRELVSLAESFANLGGMFGSNEGTATFGTLLAFSGLRGENSEPGEYQDSDDDRGFQEDSGFGASVGFSGLPGWEGTMDTSGLSEFSRYMSTYADYFNSLGFGAPVGFSGEFDTLTSDAAGWFSQGWDEKEAA